MSARRTRRLWRSMVSAIASAALCLTGAIALTIATAPASSAASGDSAIGGYRNVGYFAQWGVYGRNFHVKDIDTSGAASRLTHINYSFANIDHNTYRCFIRNGVASEGNPEGAGDAYADYGKSYNAAQSVSGVADSWDQPIMGSFNQLKQLKAKHPHLRVMISIGGWTYSKYFSKAAATDASRKALVSSCIDIYLKGNLPVIDGFGGPGTGAGIFDGIDIDWEWPGSLNGEANNHVDLANDRQNFKLLLKEFRQQLDALGAQNGRKYLLSGFLPANPVDIQGGGWNDPELFNYFDFGNIQGYDFWGTWDRTKTGHQANLWDDPKDNRAADKRYSVDKAVKAYVNNGINPAKLGIGLAAYGRGWAGVSSSAPWTNGSYQAAQGAWEAGNNDYDNIKNLGTGYYDPVAGAAWRHDGNQWWSYDNVQTINQKADYISSKGLGGGMWWELSGDRSAELNKTLMNRLAANGTGPVVPGDNGGGDNGGGDNGGGDNGGGDNGGGDNGGGDNGGSAPAWSSSAVYVKGDRVSHGGKVYEAQWWTQGEVPGTTGEWGVWRVVEGAGGGNGNGNGNGNGGNDGNNGGGSGSLPTGTSQISVAGRNLCVDIPWANPANSTQVQIVNCSGNDAQKWTRGSDGTIKALGACLDVRASGTANGTPVQVYQCNNTAAQKWVYDTATKALKNPQSGKCLDVPSSQFNEGQKLQIWNCNQTNAQRWVLG